MAAYNLFDITYRVAKELRIIHEGIASGGDANSLIDAVFLPRFAQTDYFKYGTVWVLYDSAGASAAPEGEYARVSAFDNAAGDATLAASLTAGIASGDRYAIAGPRFTLDDIIAQVNAALNEIMVEFVDKTTIDTASAQTEYSLPTDLLDERIEVDVQSVTGDANDNRWIPYHDWKIEETGTGTAKLLVFTTQPPYAYDVRITYYKPHPSLYTYTDKLRESVDINRVVLDAAYRCLLNITATMRVSDPEIKNRLQELAPRVERAKWRSPARKKGRPKLASYGLMDHYVEVTET